jgi:4-amino-4-deoxy-L-arabinose transferase-like glycosyltransferase
MEMDITGEYVVPKINGWNYYNKPPLFNWVLAGFFKIVDSYANWAVRIPSILALLLTAVLHYFFSKKYISREIALLSTLLFVTTGDLFFYGSQLAGEIDLFFSLIVYAQVILMFHFYQKQQYLILFLTTYLLTAIGALTKGLPSIVFQGVTLVAWLAYTRQLRLLLTWRHFAGIFVFAIITGLYFYGYAQKEDVVPYLVNLFKESSQRSALESNAFSTLYGALIYPGHLILFILPWSLLGLFLLSKKTWRDIKANDFLVFCAVFILANIPVYWFTAEAKSRYVYMFFPFICVILTYFYLARNRSWTKTNQVIHTLFAIIVCTVPIVAILFPLLSRETSIAHALLKGIAISIPASLIAWLYFRSSSPSRIYFVILSLVIARIGMNVLYLPDLNQKTRAIATLRHVENLLQITGDKGFYLSGDPYTQETEISFGSLGTLSSELITAPILSYSIPYYYTSKTKRILPYETEMKDGNYYLLNIEDIGEKRVDTLYTFQDGSTKDDLALVRLK